MEEYVMFATYEEFAEAMDTLKERIATWNKDRGLTTFSNDFELKLFMEEAVEFLKAHTCVEGVCELADMMFVLYGSVSKAQSEDDVELVNDMLKLVTSFTEALIKEIGSTDSKAFSAMLYHSLVAVTENNELKPLDEKDTTGKVVKGTERKDPTELVTPIMEHFGYSPNEELDRDFEEAIEAAGLLVQAQALMHKEVLAHV